MKQDDFDKEVNNNHSVTSCRTIPNAASHSPNAHQNPTNVPSELGGQSGGGGVGHIFNTGLSGFKELVQPMPDEDTDGPWDDLT